MPQELILDWDCCSGCGSCVELCPEIFELNEDVGKAYVVLPRGGDEQCIAEAIATCPLQCIYWTD